MSAAPDAALLVVDDNEDNRYTLIRRLKRHGYENVATAVNGRDALEQLAARPFDLVLLDVTMPEMNGYEVLERLQADARLRRVPVIMISALDQIDSVVRCIELGAEDYLAKPFNPTLLKARVGATLEKKRLRDEIDAHLARIEGELDWARRIQLGMMPDRFPAPTPEHPVEVFGTLQPARQIGGDLYDFFHRDAHTLCFVIADVSDKGAAAALFMARTKTLVRMVATLLRAPGGAEAAPHEIVARVNEELCRDNPQGMFVTLVFGMLDLRSFHLRYCNAGHNLPYLIGAAGELSVLAEARGKALGIRPSFAYASAERPLGSGEVLFLYTDGITEAQDGQGAQFEERRLEAALRSMAEARAEGIVRAVVGQVQAFAGGAPQSDDIAALAVRVVAHVPSHHRAERVELVVANRRTEIDRVSRVLDDLGARRRLPPDVLADMHIALDEVLINIVSYAYSDDVLHEIVIRLEADDDALEAVVEDDGKPFDPLAIAPPDRSSPLTERQVGGLGIHFVKNLMSDAAYARVGDKNRVKLVRKIANRKGAVGDGSD